MLGLVNHKLGRKIILHYKQFEKHSAIRKETKTGAGTCGYENEHQWQKSTQDMFRGKEYAQWQ